MAPIELRTSVLKFRVPLRVHAILLRSTFLVLGCISKMYILRGWASLACNSCRALNDRRRFANWQPFVLAETWGFFHCGPGKCGEIKDFKNDGSLITLVYSDANLAVAGGGSLQREADGTEALELTYIPTFHLQGPRP